VQPWALTHTHPHVHPHAPGVRSEWQLQVLMMYVCVYVVLLMMMMMTTMPPVGDVGVTDAGMRLLVGARKIFSAFVYMKNY
jgi:hypothetical protein